MNGSSLALVGVGLVMVAVASDAGANTPPTGWPAPHFPRTDLYNPNRPPPEDLWPALAETARWAEVIRARVGAPLTVISGYRPKAYDVGRGTEVARRGGTSQHWLGTALDIATPSGWSVAQFGALIDQMQRQGELPPGGMGRYPPGDGSLNSVGRGFVHWDRRGSIARWDGVS